MAGVKDRLVKYLLKVECDRCGMECIRLKSMPSTQPMVSSILMAPANYPKWNLSSS